MPGVEGESTVPNCEDKEKVKIGTAEQLGRKESEYESSSIEKCMSCHIHTVIQQLGQWKNVENYKTCYLFLWKLRAIQTFFYYCKNVLGLGIIFLSDC